MTDRMQETVGRLTDKLATGVAHFIYRKKDGSAREAFGTLKHIPKYDEAKVTKLIETMDAAKQNLEIANSEELQGYVNRAVGYFDEALQPFQPKEKKAPRESEYITYYDLEAQGFRVFHPEDVIAFFEANELGGI